MKDYVIGIIALVALVAGGVALVSKPTTVINNPAPIGAATGPDNFFTCETHNGTSSCFDRKSFLSGTTTPYSVKYPATSTAFIFCRSTSATTTAQTFTLTKGKAQQASTTALGGSFGVAAGDTRSIIASSSDSLIGGPSDWLQFNSQGGVGTPNFTGYCAVTFQF